MVLSWFPVLSPSFILNFSAAFFYHHDWSYTTVYALAFASLEEGPEGDWEMPAMGVKEEPGIVVVPEVRLHKIHV